MFFLLGSDWRRISSFSAFIFSLNNPLGLEPFKMGVNKNFTDFAATHSPQKGPIFGNGDLTLGFDSVLYLRESSSYLGRTFSLPNDYDLRKEVYGFGLLAETVLFTWDDMEVFYYDGKRFEANKSVTQKLDFVFGSGLLHSLLLQ